jgi:NAD dependent epimerase/dehydratase family enzyme
MAPNVPAFLIKLALGEMAKLLLTGRRVSNDKVKSLDSNLVIKILRTP